MVFQPSDLYVRWAHRLEFNMKIKQGELGIGHNLRRLRNASGLTQEQVVAKLTIKGLPIDRSVYAHMERSRYNIKVAELLALKEIFKVSSFDEFFLGLVLEPPKENSIE